MQGDLHPAGGLTGRVQIGVMVDVFFVFVFSSYGVVVCVRNRKRRVVFLSRIICRCGISYQCSGVGFYICKEAFFVGVSVPVVPPFSVPPPMVGYISLLHVDYLQ